MGEETKVEASVNPLKSPDPLSSGLKVRTEKVTGHTRARRRTGRDLERVLPGKVPGHSTVSKSDDPTTDLPTRSQKRRQTLLLLSWLTVPTTLLSYSVTQIHKLTEQVRSLVPRS